MSMLITSGRPLSWVSVARSPEVTATFDGRQAHGTLPFDGERFSLVYFVDSRFIRYRPSAPMTTSMRSGYEFSGLPTITWDEYGALPESQKHVAPNSNVMTAAVEAGKHEFETFKHRNTGAGSVTPKHLPKAPLVNTLMVPNKKATCRSDIGYSEINGVVYIDDSSEDETAVLAGATPPGSPQKQSRAVASGLRPWCQYGHKCYRKNPEHFLRYRHPPGWGAHGHDQVL